MSERADALEVLRELVAAGEHYRRAYDAFANQGADPEGDPEVEREYYDARAAWWNANDNARALTEAPAPPTDACEHHVPLYAECPACDPAPPAGQEVREHRERVGTILCTLVQNRDEGAFADQLNAAIDRLDELYAKELRAALATSPAGQPETPRTLQERYWCGCVRHARWERCEDHGELEHDEEPPPQSAGQGEAPAEVREDIAWGSDADAADRLRFIAASTTSKSDRDALLRGAAALERATEAPGERERHVADVERLIRRWGQGKGPHRTERDVAIAIANLDSPEAPRPEKEEA